MTRVQGLTLLALAFVLAGCHKQSEDTASKSSDTSGGSKSEGKSASVPSDVVRIEPQNQGKAGITYAAVTVRSMPRMLTVPAQVVMDERHTQHIGVFADGRIESLSALPGDSVRRGQTLGTLHSHTVHETVAALVQAFAAVKRQESAVAVARTARDRYARLYSIQAASLEEKERAEQSLAQANKDLIDAEANVKAEREHLGELLQVPPESLTPANIYNRELIPIRAVADGVVISRSITVGQVVNTGDEAFTTSNLSTVWVSASVNEKDVPLIHRGASVAVTIQGADMSPLRGTVDVIGDVVDAQTRTLPVRVVVRNPDLKLRPGMFVSTSIAGEQVRNAIFVPSASLQDINGFRVVFTTGDGSNFQARAVKTGAETNGMVEVLEGLTPQDRIVVSGAFMVKGELLKGTVGEG